MEETIGKGDEKIWRHQIYRYTAARYLSLANLLLTAQILDNRAVAGYITTCLQEHGLFWCAFYDCPHEAYCRYAVCFECFEDTRGGCGHVCPYLRVLTPYICGITQTVRGELERGDFESAAVTLIHAATKILNYLEPPSNGYPSVPGDTDRPTGGEEE
jgi:hypothetical protein